MVRDRWVRPHLSFHRAALDLHALGDEPVELLGVEVLLTWMLVGDALGMSMSSGGPARWASYGGSVMGLGLGTIRD